MSYPFVRCLSIVTVFLGLSVTSQATTYNFTTIDVPGASTTEAHGINADGLFARDNDLCPGVSATSLDKINEMSYLFVRFINIVIINLHLSLTSHDTTYNIIDVTLTGAKRPEAHGINAAGQIVGTFITD